MEHPTVDLEHLPSKEKILSVAIDLFAQRGYNGVSMREIAAEVGIKAASIYNHYPSKEAILEEIVGFFRRQLQSRVYPEFGTDAEPDIAGFLQNITRATEGFFAVPLYAKIGRIVLQEQFQNQTVRDALLQELIVRPRQVISAYFERLIAAGKMRPVDPVVAAKEYHAFFIYHFYESSLSQGAADADPQRIQQEQEEHVRLFLRNFCL